MLLHMQDPTSATAPSLHEKILEACQGSLSGGGAFAFATRDGAELLIDDPVFRTLLSTGTFDLVVGIDEITNVRALNALHGLAEGLPGLSVQVFLHKVSKATFHPKFCWFRRENDGVLITGSGNLTVRGLRWNWEAFTVNILTLAQLEQVENFWNEWIGLHPDWLLSPDDKIALARAAQNIIRRPSKKVEEPEDELLEEGEPEEADEIIASDEEIQSPLPTSAVLVAEIPKASTRWNQANFDRNNFENFFGMTIGNTTLRVVMQHIDFLGIFGPIEMRQGVSVLSQNYRLELHAAAGLKYPADGEGRPIGIFVRVAPRTFRYQLVMPNHPDYELVSEFLSAKWVGRADRMRRIITNVAELSAAYPRTTLLT